MKKKKVHYRRGDGIIEVTVRDEDGKKVDHFKSNILDKRKIAWIAGYLFSKYGIDMTPKLRRDIFDF